MKHKYMIMAALAGLSVNAAVPLTWTNAPGMAPRALPPVPHGSAIEFSVTLEGYTEPPVAAGADVRMWFQTNGMGSAWWSAPAVLDGNTITAAFGPAQDTGADRVSLFFGAPSNVFASAVLRLTHAPGFEPNVIELPVAQIDFANIAVFNAPYYTKNETDDLIDYSPANGELAATIAEVAPAPDLSTNNAVLVETIQAKAPAPGNYAAVSNAAMNALSRAEAGLSAWSLTPDPHALWSIQYEAANGLHTGGWLLVVDSQPVEFYEADETATKIPFTDYTATRTRLPTMADIPTAQINAATTTNELQDTAIGDLSNDNAQTRAIVTTWENFLDGSNVVFSITNYLSGAYNLDAAKLRIQELRDGEYREVYNSRDEILLHIDDFSNRCLRVAMDAVVNEVAARLASKADRDWGKYTSAGGEAPSNTVYMTAPNTVFAGGLEYERVAVGEGSICVLTTRGAPVWTQGDEGTFRFQDDGGTNYFGFAKTDSYTIGANTDGITVRGGMVTMNYNITMSGRPCVWYKSSLSPSAADWEQLNLPDGSPVPGATYAVSWETTPAPGTQVCYLNVGTSPQGFFRATVEVAGEAKFMTNMPADLSGGIISTNTATGVNGVVRPTFNGSNVIWNWSAK